MIAEYKTKTTIVDELFAVPDIHYPQSNDKLIDNIFVAAEERQPSLFVQGGDIFNFEKLSRFAQDPRRKEDLPAVIQQGKNFFRTARMKLPNSRIIVKFGNHDYRFEKFILEKAPNLIDLPELQLPYLLGCEQFNVEAYQPDEPLFIDGLKITHGTRYSSAGPSYTAMAEMRHAESGVNGLSFHIHDFSKVYMRDRFWLTGGFCGSMNRADHGYLGDTNPSWKAGFVHGYRIKVERRDKKGRFQGSETKWLLNPIEAFGPDHDKFVLEGKIYGA